MRDLASDAGIYHRSKMYVIKDNNTGLCACHEDGEWHSDAHHEKVHKHNAYDVALVRLNQLRAAGHNNLVVMPATH